MASTSKKLIVILGLVLLTGFGLAMMIQLEETPTAASQPTEVIALASGGGPERTFPVSRTQLLPDSTDSVSVASSSMYYLWKVEVTGIDSIFDGDTIEFSLRIIGQDTSFATDIHVRWDTTNSAVTWVSGDTAKSHSFTKDDTLTLPYTFVLSDTGRYSIRLEMESDSTFSCVSTFSYAGKCLSKFLYILAYGDTTGSVDSVWVDASTLPSDEWLDPDDADTTEALMTLMTPMPGYGYVSGKVFYKFHGEEFPCKYIKVKIGCTYDWCWADEEGNFTLKAPKHRNLRIRVKAINKDAGEIPKPSGIGNLTIYKSQDQIWAGLSNQNLELGTCELPFTSATKSAGWLLNRIYDCYEFCYDHFLGWTPDDQQVKIKFEDNKPTGYDYSGCRGKIIIGYDLPASIPYTDEEYDNNRDIVATALAAEYAHHVDKHANGGVKEGSPPPGNQSGLKKHYMDDHSSYYFAYYHGWAWFFSRAVAHHYYDMIPEWQWWRDTDSFYVDPYLFRNFHKPKPEPLWSDSGPLSYQALPDDSSWGDGRRVEGAVAQFFWDLCDTAMTEFPGYHGGYDDDDLGDMYEQVWLAYKRDINPGAGQTYPQTVEQFKTAWNQLYPNTNIEELWSVVVHPTCQRTEYDVAKARNLEAEYVKPEQGSPHIKVTWDHPLNSDNSNRGHYKVYRQDSRQLDHWQESDIQSYEHRNSKEYIDTKISEGACYYYGIRAVCNDTSDIVVTDGEVCVPIQIVIICDIFDFGSPQPPGAPPLVPGTMPELGWEIVADLETPTSVDIDFSTDGGATYTNIASDLEPGTPDQLLDAGVDDNGDSVKAYGWKGFYSDWTVPNTPTTGAKFRYCVHLEGGDSTIGYSKLNYAIANETGTLLSTAYTSDKMDDGSSKTCMVYTDASNNVRYTESDDGFEWDTTITVVQAGVTPTVTIVNDTPVVVWKDTDIADQTLYRSVFPFTAVTMIVPAYGFGVQILSEANVFTVEDSFYVGVFRAYGGAQPSDLALIGKRSDLGGCASTDTLFNATGSPVSTISEAPALVVDNEHNTYYAFVYDGKTAFIHDDGSSLDIDTIATTSVAWPSLDVTTGNVYLTYGTVVSGDTVILRKWRYTDDTIWRGTDTLYKGPVTHLSTAGGVFTSFTEPDEDMKLLTFDPLDGSAGTEDLADSIINPHVALSRLSGPELAFEWTERVGANYYVMSERSDADAYLPHLYLEAGTTITPFTTHRDRTYDYGEIEVDIGTDSLVYEIEDLDTSLDYKLRLEFYFESETTDSTDYIITAAGETDTVTVHEETLSTHTMEIDSLGTDLTVKITGDDVGLTRLVFYEDNTGGGGTSSWSEVKDPDSEKRLPFMFSLESVIPTPFTKTAQIRFAMPVTQHVTLKVYDVTGREVRTLVNGPVEAGVHTLEWNGKDNLSRSVASGVYFVRMATEGYQASRKTVLLK